LGIRLKLSVLLLFLLIYFVEARLYIFSNFLYPEKFSEQSKRISPGWDKALAKKLKQTAQKEEEKETQKVVKQAKKVKKAKQIKKQLPKELFIRSWLICGPFPNPGGRKKGEVVEDVRKVGCKGFDEDFLISQGGEINVEPREGMKQVYQGSLSKGKKHRCGWQVKESPEAMIDFYKQFDPYEYIIVYAVCYVISDETKDALIKLGSDDGYKLWVNHKLIGWDHIHRSSLPDQNTHRIKLKKGKNIILIKIDQDFGGINFYLRLTDLKGKALSRIRLALAP